MLLRKIAKRYGLLVTVFITGACVLIVEIVATRMLSPYFGNTMFTVSSVIGVVLAALSIGYYVGGKFADRQPRLRVFFSIVLAGGVSVFGLYWLHVLLLPAIGNALPLVSGPLVASLLLFFVPSFLLGMLSPFAIKLQQMMMKGRGVGIGTISGEMFFYSTMGSIVGSLAAGYVLIPMVGVRATIIGVAAVLLLLGLVPLLYLGIDKRFAGRFGFLIGLTMIVSLFSHPSQQVVYSHDGLYERITIADTNRDGRPVRLLMQDRSASGAMYLDSDELVYDYTKYYALHELFTPSVQRVLAIGGGAYSVPKAYLKDLPHAHVDVAEIEPSLVHLSEQYFNVPTNEPRLTHHIDDGRRLLTKANQPYDVIFSDVYYSFYSIPMHFTTQQFFQTAHDKLRENGILIMNLIGSLDTRPPSLLYAELRTIRTVFPNVYVFATESVHTNALQNIIVVAHKSNQRVAFDAAQLQSSRHEVMRKLAENQIALSGINLDHYPLLTDDYAPIEHWTAQMLRRPSD